MKINKKIDNVYHIEFGSDDDRANARIYRYDTGQLIKFYDIPDGVEVQFSNEHSTNGTINKRITDSMVQIPDSLLTSKDNIIAYIKYIDENSETTTKLIKFGLLDRAKPGDYVSPDEEPSFRSFVEEQLKEAKETVEKNKDYLKETIENTEKSKEYMDATDANRRTVEGLTEKNKEYATQTESNAESANTSASNASESASNASQSASNAKGSADNASVSAKEAKDAAVKAGTSESNAKEAENNINSAVTEFEQTKRESLTEIGNLTTNSKEEISNLTDAKKTELNKINDDITQNAGELKEAIVNAADAKKEEINQKGLEVLASIPEDMGKIQDTTLIKSTESGTEINLTDSSDMNIQELHFFGKSEQKTTKGIQLLDLSSMKSGTGDGLTYTNRGDGSVQVSGTATSQVGNIWFKGKYDTDSEKLTTLLTLEAGKKYYIKDCILFEGITNINTQTEVIEVSAEEYPEGRRITGIRNPRQVVGKTYNEVIYPLIAESSTAVEWEEYTGGQPSPSPDYPQGIESVENPTIKIGGSNILNFENKESFEKNGIVCVVTDGIVKTKGTATLKTTIYLKGSYYIENGTYIFNPNPTKGTETYESYIDLTNQVNLGMSIKSAKINKPITVDDNISKYPFALMISISKGATIDIEWKPQLLRNDTLLTYESYKEIQSVQQTCELNGIDDVRDELIVRADGTGHLIKKLAKKTINGSNITASAAGQQEGSYLINLETVSDMLTGNYNVGLSTIATNKGSGKEKNTIRFGANNKNVYLYSNEAFAGKTATELREYFAENPFTIVYPLEEPIVTELSPEEVQKILALHTNKPNTTIWNDQNADMQITYIADTKSYIDKKFKELSDAIVASASEAE